MLITKRRTLLAVLMLTGSAFGQGGARSGEIIKSSAGQSGTVRVCTSAATGTPCAPLAAIYSDPSLSTPQSNPLTTDSYGNYSYFAAAGHYKEQIAVGSSTVTTPVTIPSDGSDLATHEASTSAHSATSANTANRIVMRDGAGNFSAGTISASLSGNASTASALASNGSNCGASSAAGGTDAAGNAEDCVTVPSTTRLITFPVGDDFGSTLTDTLDYSVVWRNHFGFTIYVDAIYCETDTGTSTINLTRNDGSPADIAAANLVCSTSGVSTTSFNSGENVINDTYALGYKTVQGATSGTPHKVLVTLKVH